MGIQTDSKTVIKQRIDNELTNLRPELRPADTGTVEYAITGTVAEVELANQHFANRAIDAVSVTSATGSELDKWAEVVGLRRRVSENDVQLRNRIYRRASNADAALESNSGYIDRVLEVEGVARAWAGTPGGGRTTIWAVLADPGTGSQPGTRGAWLPLTTEREAITEHLASTQSAATTVNVYSPRAVPVTVTVTADSITDSIRETVNSRIQDFALGAFDVITYQQNTAPDFTNVLATAQNTSGLRNLRAVVTSNGYDTQTTPEVGTLPLITVAFVLRV